MRPRRFRLALLCCLSVALATGTLRSTPPTITKADPLPKQSERAQRAGLLFWEAFHGNDYCKIDAVIAELAAAYQETPCDPVLTTLLGAAHNWKFQERRRVCRSAADFRDHLVVSVQLFERSAKLDPRNRIVPGLAVAAKATLGVLDNNKALVDQAYDEMKKNTKADVVVHGFVEGWVMSALMQHDDPRYGDNLEWFFLGFDKCAGIRVPRLLPIVPRIALAWLSIRGLADNVCYNTDVAPHNLEATLMGLGDVFLKQGRVAQARMSYNSVKRCPNYAGWVYKDQLEHRLKNLETLRDKFRADTGKLDVAEPAMFFQSAFACTGCHAK